MLLQRDVAVLAGGQPSAICRRPARRRWMPFGFVPGEMTADQIREINTMCQIENELIDEALGRVLGHIDKRGVTPDPRMQGAPLPTMSDNDRERVITEWDGGYDGQSITLRTICRDGFVCTVCEPGTAHDGHEGELYDLAADPRQFDNLWDDPARASLKSDLIADLYDNLPVARTPALEQVALV
jgi:hypothetical protein